MLTSRCDYQLASNPADKDNLFIGKQGAYPWQDGFMQLYSDLRLADRRVPPPDPIQIYDACQYAVNKTTLSTWKVDASEGRAGEEVPQLKVINRAAVHSIHHPELVQPHLSRPTIILSTPYPDLASPLEILVLMVPVAPEVLPGHLGEPPWDALDVHLAQVPRGHLEFLRITGMEAMCTHSHTVKLMLRSSESLR